MQTILCLIFFHHQTTTQQLVAFPCEHCVLSSFIIKPQLRLVHVVGHEDCVLSSFIIKPQLWQYCRLGYVIVSYLLSSSNHNRVAIQVLCTFIVSYLLSSSNHNRRRWLSRSRQIVSYLLSSSNHN